MTEFLICIIVLELLLWGLVSWLRIDFPWLITARDIKPEFDKQALKKFIDYSYDSTLGWVRKANTSKEEPIKSAGEKGRDFKMSSFSIGLDGARTNPGHESLETIVSTYGDSFAFCRHVNDDETWQWHLSEMTSSNVQNFGVGNFGLDQAVMRLKLDLEHKRPTARVMLMMVVPETITRIVNVWKHYSEYGNTFGFKGRYVLNGKTLQWLINPLSEPAEFEHISKHLPWIQKNDYCFLHKFLPDLLQFPHLWFFLKHAKRHAPLVFALLQRKLAKCLQKEDAAILSKPWELVLERNAKFAIDLFQNEEISQLFKHIVLEFKALGQEQSFMPVFVLAPYLHDLSYIKDQGHYYQPLLESLAKELPVLDLAEDFLKSTGAHERYFVNRFYGAHYSPEGNRFVAERIHHFLKQNLPSNFLSS